jgi:hypothetical protein
MDLKLSKEYLLLWQSCLILFVFVDNYHGYPITIYNWSYTMLWVNTRFMQQDGVSPLDLIIRQSLYWPDGTSKRSKSCAMQRSKDQMRRLVQALLDKYNEDHHLLGVCILFPTHFIEHLGCRGDTCCLILGTFAYLIRSTCLLFQDLAYELSDFVRCNTISEHNSWYCHLNFSANSKARDDSDNTTSNLFFGEVKHSNRGKHREVFICCFCTVDPNDEGIVHTAS